MPALTFENLNLVCQLIHKEVRKKYDDRHNISTDNICALHPPDDTLMTDTVIETLTRVNCP